MRRALALAMLLGLLVPVVPETARAAGGGKTVVLRGQYTWTQQEEPGEISGTFEPDGDGKWTVKFDFTANGEKHSWSGTAAGKMGQEIHGEVVNQGRTHTFDGKFEDGVYRAEHALVEEGKSPQPMGTLTLK